LKKNPAERFTWKKFFEHEYLKNDNRPLYDIRESMFIDPNNQGGFQNIQNEKSLYVQDILSFYPHGKKMKIYLKLTHTIESIKKILCNTEQIPIEDCMLISTKGAILQDDKEFVYYKIENGDEPIVFLNKNVFEKDVFVPPLVQEYNLPENYHKLLKQYNEHFSQNTSSEYTYGLAYKLFTIIETFTKTILELLSRSKNQLQIYEIVKRLIFNDLQTIFECFMKISNYGILLAKLT